MKVTRYLRDVLERQYGGVGFERLLQRFKKADHFQTYCHERDPSFSTNCNVPLALLHTPNHQLYDAEIELALRFLHLQHDRRVLRDRRNVSFKYPRMLLASALIKLLQTWDEGQGPPQELPDDCIQKAPVILSAILQKRFTCSIQRTGHGTMAHSRSQPMLSSP
ncbi:hypothetical protein BDV11DRAFT_172166 [Aspergillus similis]